MSEQAPLRQKHYLGVRAKHGWPSVTAITRTGNETEIGGFQAMLDEARRRRCARSETSERDAA